jgi:hypothetical protein
MEIPIKIYVCFLQRIKNTWEIHGNPLSNSMFVWEIHGNPHQNLGKKKT